MQAEIAELKNKLMILHGTEEMNKKNLHSKDLKIEELSKKIEESTRNKKDLS